MNALWERFGHLVRELGKFGVVGFTAYLTFSRSLNSAQADQIILLEYDASDRLSWVLSRNEDQSYALEFRVRHVF